MKKKWPIVTLSIIAIYIVVCIVAAILDIGQGESKVAPVGATPKTEVIDPFTIYNLVNEQRVKASVQPLSNNPLATKAAQQKCQEMVDQDYFEHINPKTGVHGYQFAINAIPKGTFFNENLTEGGAVTNAEVVQFWLDSAGHKATLLEPKYTDTGLAVCHRPSQPADSHIVVQEFVQIPPTPTTTNVQVQAPRRPIHCSSYEIYGTINTNCY